MIPDFEELTQPYKGRRLARKGREEEGTIGKAKKRRKRTTGLLGLMSKKIPTKSVCSSRPFSLSLSPLSPRSLSLSRTGSHAFQRLCTWGMSGSGVAAVVRNTPARLLERLVVGRNRRVYVQGLAKERTDSRLCESRLLALFGRGGSSRNPGPALLPCL